MAKILMGMSGGVDSSVAAWLLKKQGHEVIGLTLQLWQYPGVGGGMVDQNFEPVFAIAKALDIPLFITDVRDRFRKSVVQFFIEGYQAGITPNPCFYCNRILKWAVMLEEAEQHGCEYVASGHYAQLKRDDTGLVHLLRGDDPVKDQSYVLSSLRQAQLQKVRLPLSNYLKPEIREIAELAGLPAADAVESQDICFLPNDAYGEMLLQYSPSVSKKGPIVDTAGKVIGEHQGLAFYTIGQRKGLGIYAPVPMYVLRKEIDTNTLVVGSKEQLGQKSMIVSSINWIMGEAPVLPVTYDVEIRYHATPHRGTLDWIAENRIRIEFDEALRDITPGQAAVFYQQQEVIGSGIIELN